MECGQRPAYAFLMSVESFQVVCYQLASKLDLRTSLGMFALWGGFLWVGSSVQNSKSEEEKIIDIHIHCILYYILNVM